MTARDDGGPVHPVPQLSNLGISVRDHFAAQALIGLIVSRRVGFWDSSGLAYRYADAMLAERAKAGA